MLQNILEYAKKKLISGFDIEAVKKKFPLVYEDCMNSILIQEIMRYNSFLAIVMNSLEDTVKAFQGVIPLSDEFETIASQLVNNITPASWIKISYPSRKPINSWINDLCSRLNFFKEWIDLGQPPQKFWFSAFFFTQSFLTAIKQNYARKHKVSIDNLDFSFEYADSDIYDVEAVVKREKYYTFGLFIEGAEWNNHTHCIDELRGKNISAQMPPVRLKFCLLLITY